MPQTKENPNQCGYCGKVYPTEVRHHSGVRECWLCWEWRKLGHSQASYWNDQIELIFSDGKGSSGPDFNDYNVWRKWGWRDEIVDALNVLESVRVRYEIALNADRDTRNSVMYESEGMVDNVIED